MFGVDFKLPRIVVLFPLDITDVNTGKFCRLFAPTSASVASLAVTPLSPRSIPNPSLEKMELPRIEFLKALESPTPNWLLKAILLAAPLCIPPTILLNPFWNSTPPRRLGSGPVPAAFNPMRFPWIIFPCGASKPPDLNCTPTAFPEMMFRASGVNPPIKLLLPRIAIPGLRVNEDIMARLPVTSVPI